MMKRIAVTQMLTPPPAAGFDSPPKLRMIPAMDEKPARMNPKRWMAFLPLVILPLLAAAVIEGPRLRRMTEHQIAAALVAAGQGWAKVTVTGRDVEIRGEAPSPEAAAVARSLAAATFGVRRVDMHVGTVPAKMPE
ncbi:hypothetical protein [Aestuariivirga sp.]|uniref:hypothetical protein n=1 Tax=Aestuariivirga sp. TaxID=2650926 RepID=UPI0035B01893